jgi:hypothetical protein
MIKTHSIQKGLKVCKHKKAKIHHQIAGEGGKSDRHFNFAKVTVHPLRTTVI